MTTEQERIRDLQDQLTRARAKSFALELENGVLRDVASQTRTYTLAMMAATLAGPYQHCQMKEGELAVAAERLLVEVERRQDKDGEELAEAA